MVERSNDEKSRVADRIVKLALEAGLEVFNTPTGETYGRMPVDGHTEVHRVNHKAFRGWLSGLYYAETGHGYSNRDQEEVKDNLEAQAAFQGHVEPVYVRIAEHNGKVYLDLANDAWEVVEVTKHGWQVVQDPRSISAVSRV